MAFAPFASCELSLDGGLGGGSNAKTALTMPAFAEGGRLLFLGHCHGWKASVNHATEGGAGQPRLAAQQLLKTK